jgi:hypothetical protein
MTAPVALRMPAFDQLAQHLNVPIGHDFMAAKTLIAMIEAVAPRMNEIDRLQIGRLIISTGHEITLSCRQRRF